MKIINNTIQKYFLNHFTFWRSFSYSFTSVLTIALVIYYGLLSFFPSQNCIKYVPYACMIIPDFTKQIASPITSLMKGNAHPLSWTMVFAYSAYVRLSLMKGKDFLEVAQNTFESILIPAMGVGATEFIWDTFYAIWLTKNYTHPTYFISSAFIGMMLAGTAITVGLMTVRQSFNQKRLIFAFTVLILYHAIWLYTGYHLTSEPQYANDFITHLTEVGHWGVGIISFWFAYGFNWKTFKNIIIIFSDEK